ncbi:hypothetical protein BHM03_00040946 [Ensete ventricosum]|nr:hypothetical protein BHM03_00040946 [Ensete ventricosum]
MYPLIDEPYRFIQILLHPSPALNLLLSFTFAKGRFGSTMIQEECDVVLRLAVGGGEKTPVQEISARLMRSATKREEAEGTRRKLRLSEEQLSLLEDSFRAHNTLAHLLLPMANPRPLLAGPEARAGAEVALAAKASGSMVPKQKSQVVVLQLSSTLCGSRNVSSWTWSCLICRSKLKQTEEYCESLRKCCQRLTSENRRLERELMKLRAARLRMCSSCEKMVRDEKKTSSLDTINS